MPESDVPASSRVIGGFWRRSAAFAIDGAVLWGIGLGVGWVAFDGLVQMGRWGGLVGLVIATAYFGVLDSVVGRGRTLGKWIAGLEVVTPDGRPVGLLRSVLRTLLIAVPWFSGGWPFSARITYDVAGFFIRFSEVMIPFAALYLVAFDRCGRRGLHDLVASTYVVTRTSGGPVRAARPWRGHGAVIAFVACLFAVSFVRTRADIGRTAPRTDPSAENIGTATLNEIQKTGRVHTSSVGGTLLFPSGESSLAQPSLEASAHWKTRPENPEAAAAAVAAILLRAIPGAETAATIDVTIEYGYAIGIGRSRTSLRFSRTPAQWRAHAAASPL